MKYTMTADINTTSTTDMYEYLISVGYSDDYLNSITREKMVEIINTLYRLYQENN